MGTIRDLMIRLGVDANVEEGIGKATAALKGAEGKFRLAGAALGGAVGATMADGLAKSMDIGVANDKLAAQLGATGPEAEKLGKLAASLYAKGFGDDIGQVNEALRGVMQNIGGMSTASDADVQKVTGGVVNLGKAFDQDVGATSRAVGKMIKTGLATDANQALDILTRGFQTGTNEADDLLDTVSEYSTKFRDIGLTGDQAMGLLSQGLKGGARDADTVADSLKEFAIRAVDGSKSTVDGFASIGLSSDQMASQIKRGGPAASNALQIVLDRLRNMEDPVKRNATAVQLFGTKAEDLGDALFALDPSTAVAALGTVGGAADAMGNTLADNAQSKIEVLKRGFEGMIQSAVNTQGPLGTVATVVAGFGTSALAVGGDVAQIGSAFGGLMGKVGPAIGGVVSGFATMVGSAVSSTATAVGSLVAWAAKWIWLGLQALINAAKVAAAWLIALGPIGIVIAAVIALVALIILNWDKIKHAISIAWEWIKGVTSTIWDGIKSVLSGVWNWITGTVSSTWNTITGAIGKGWQAVKDASAAVWNFIVNAVKTGIGILVGLFLNFVPAGIIIKHWDAIKNAAVSAWNTIVGWIKTAVSNIGNAIGAIAAIPGRVIAWFGQLRQGAINKLVELLTWIRDLPGKIVSSLGNIGNLLVQVGRNLLIGLWNGLVNMTQWLYDKITGFFGGVVDWVKNALGIGSPSKEMAKLGRFSMLGFGQGIQKTGAEVLRIASGVMDSVTGVFTSPVTANAAVGISGTSSAPATPTYGYAGTDMTGNPNGSIVVGSITLQFADDRDMYAKGQDFAAGLREYKRRGGVIPV